MAYARRATDKDATWARAWTADAEADLADIPDPRRGDWAYVSALAEWRVWTDDGQWRALTPPNDVDLAWDKKFFADAGLIPANERIVASIVTPPTPDGNPAGAYAPAVGGGTIIPAAPSLVYWDLGALRSEVLVVFSAVQKPSNVNTGIFLSSAAPIDGNPDGYIFAAETGGFVLSKNNGGYTPLATGNNIMPAIGSYFGLALYYKDSTGVVKCFVRGGGRWMQVISTTDSTFTTKRYVSWRFGASDIGQILLPIVAYSD